MESLSNWPIFILSLEDAHDRRAPLIQSLQELELSYEVLYGVDGRRGLPDWAKKHVLRRRSRWGKRPMTDGEFGCALSHQKAYRTIIERKLPGAIIFEDDARLREGFRELIESGKYKLGEMTLLGHRMCWVDDTPVINVSDDLLLYRVKVRPHLAHAYAVSRSSAEKILSASTPLREPADWPCDISKFTTFAVDPQVACQEIGNVAQSHLEADRQKMLQNQSRFFVTNKRRRKILKRLHWSFWRKEMTRKMYKKIS